MAMMRVRGAIKVNCYLMLGILALMVHQSNSFQGRGFDRSAEKSLASGITKRLVGCLFDQMC